MKSKKKFIALFCMLLSVLLLTGCDSINTALSGDNAQFVRSIVQSINTHKDVSGSLDSGDSTLYSLKTTPILEPYFKIRDLKVSADKDNKSVIHYSCTIPGLVGAVFNMVYERDFLVNDQYSAPVSVEGDLKIITTERGTRKIDISGDDNIFSVYASMRHINPMKLMKLSDRSKDSMLNWFLDLETELYAGLTGITSDEYAKKVVMPDLENYIDNLETISASVDKTGTGSQFLNKVMSLDWNNPFIYIPIIIFMVLIILYKINDGFDFLHTIHDRSNLRSKWKQQVNTLYTSQKDKPLPKTYKTLLKNDRTYDTGYRINAMTKLSYPQDRNFLVFLVQEDEESGIRQQALRKLENSGEEEIFLHAAKEDENPKNREIAIDQLSYPEHRSVLADIARSDIDAGIRYKALSKLSIFEDPDIFLDRTYKSTDEKDRLRAAIIYTQFPQKAGKDLHELCHWIQNGLNNESGDVTLAGWSAAALGRILTADMSPDEIETNLKQLSSAIDRHNSLVKKIKKTKEEIDSYRELNIPDISFGPSGLTIGSGSIPNDLISRFKDLQKELSSGMGAFMLDNGDKPFAWLVHILQDNQSRVPRFIKQGVIMGLLDWLMANAGHPKAKELLDTVIAVRADLIRSDNELSFFEIRVPEDCIRDDYARIFEMVLHTANPSLPFCNTKVLLELAEKEVPGVMEMLRKYPLRLIDPVNRSTLGFYKFEPYVHAMWIQYQPPKDTGKVTSRYHEVDDRTKPLSSGLNLQLFRDIYSVIPTLFHEYQHFGGDPNEASVFLKTQVFSVSFYKRYADAKASRDAVFARMTEVIGQPPLAEKCGALNTLIRQYYGVEVTREQASAHADQLINILNSNIIRINREETWDPSVKFPLFTEEEDVVNRDLIHDITIRWDMTPKSITEKEFQKILSDAG